MNLIEQLLSQNRKEELIELFESMQVEMRELNRDKMNLQERVKILEKKVSYWRKRYSQTQKIEW